MDGSWTDSESQDEDFKRLFSPENQAAHAVLQQCEGRFLFACRECYNMNPRMLVEFSSRDSQCRCCSKANKIFLHEKKTENDDGVMFHEYQVIRERKSGHEWANAFCRYRTQCNYGDGCRFVHTFMEMVVWKAESHKNRYEHSSRENLAAFSRSSGNNFEGQILHCPYCCRNFFSNGDYAGHLDTKCHKNMQKLMSSKRDMLWYYKPCSTDSPQRCKSFEECSASECEHAHSEQELQEWQIRAALDEERCRYKEEYPAINWVAHIEERMKTGKIKEFKSQALHHKIGIKDEDASWTRTYKIAQDDKNALSNIVFLQSLFKLRYKTKDHTKEEYVQHLPVLETAGNKFELEIRFENPGIFGLYTGTLAFDFGEDRPIVITQFNVTIEGNDELQQQTVEIGILGQNWNQNRIVIPYPNLQSGEVEYEINVTDLEKKYEIPQEECLEPVYLENLTPETYTDHMHNFLYKEELARQKVLSGLNIECELQIESQIFTKTSGFMGSKNDGSLYGQFSSPQRLSTDSDEGVLVRDSCSKVFIGTKEGSSIAYECLIEKRENSQVYISLPARCVSDLDLKSGSKKSFVVQYKLERTKFCLRHYAIDSLEERIRLICPRAMTYAKMNDCSYESHFLDDAQNSVLSQIHATKQKDRFNPGPKSYPPLVVAGPFGTGKTHTIRNVILSILELNGVDSRILLCTHSNR